ncbi:hypothetical protein D3C74_323290 [compost metagenome]
MVEIEKINLTLFEDEFGNVIQEFEVIEYDKRADGEWTEENRHKSGRSYYNVDGQLYYRYSSGIIKLNMDFSSESCGRCFVIGESIISEKKITGNTELFAIKLNLLGTKFLKRQDYSDGSCFFTIQDNRGNWKIEHGSNSIKPIINQIEHEKKVHENSKGDHNEIVEEYKQLISFLKEIK